MATIVNDKALVTALAGCSPHIQSFLNRLNAKDPIIDWAFLDRNGYKKSGVYFRVVASTRSMIEQITEFEKGRKAYYNKKYAGLSASYPFAGTKYELTGSQIVDGSKVVTNTFGGKSYHNYGLAVDLIPVKTGWQLDKLPPGNLTVESVFKYAHLDKLAKDCGLEWGGEWSINFRDPWHFQDSNFKIPGGYDFNYDRNCTFNFINDFNSGKFGNLAIPTSSGSFFSKVGRVGFIACLGFLAFCLAKKR